MGRDLQGSRPIWVSGGPAMAARPIVRNRSAFPMAKVDSWHEAEVVGPPAPVRSATATGPDNCKCSLRIRHPDAGAEAEDAGCARFVLWCRHRCTPLEQTCSALVAGHGGDWTRASEVVRSGHGQTRPAAQQLGRRRVRGLCNHRRGRSRGLRPCCRGSWSQGRL